MLTEYVTKDGSVSGQPDVARIRSEQPVPPQAGFDPDEE